MTDTQRRDAGSGKTTLLNTLAGRLQDGRDGATVKGRVLLNNRVAAADQIKRAVGATPSECRCRHRRRRRRRQSTSWPDLMCALDLPHWNDRLCVAARQPPAEPHCARDAHVRGLAAPSDLALHRPEDRQGSAAIAPSPRRVCAEPDSDCMRVRWSKFSASWACSSVLELEWEVHERVSSAECFRSIGSTCR